MGAVLTAIGIMRAWTSSFFAAAGLQATLRAVVERYPELTANEAFLSLQRELSGTEKHVALARDYYNEIATKHNTRLEIIPDRWLAPLAGLRPRPLLTAESFERAAVTLQWAAGKGPPKPEHFPY